jgi:hypothetical protein
MSIKEMYGELNPLEAKKPGNSGSRLTFEIPGADKPLVCKFLFDPATKRQYIPMLYYPHQTGPEQSDRRFHPSRGSLGLGKDMEGEARFEIIKKIKSLKDAGAGESAEANVLRKKLDRSKPKEKGWFFYIEPGSPEIKAVNLPVMAVNELFGREYATKEPIPSLIKKMAAKKVGPYDVASDNAERGWVKIWKTGEGLGTKYHVVADEIKESKTNEDGETVEVTKLVSHPLADKIKNLEFTAEDYPNPLEFEQKSAFTEAETQKFIESEGTEVPSRFLKSNSVGGKQYPAGKRNVEELDGPGLTASNLTDSQLAAQLDDIPF